MADTDDLTRIIRLDVNASQALAQLDKLNKATGNVDKNMQTMADSMQAGVDKIRNVVGVLTTAFAAFKSIKAITEAGDAVRSLTGSFEALLGSADRATDMVGEVFSIVENTGAKFDDVGQSVQRLSIALAGVGASNDTIAQIAENFIKLGRIGGSSMDDVSRAMVQFTQALASGRLGGDELKSILEGMPLVAKEIADELGVSVGELKELGSQGKITGDVLVNALLKNTEKIADQFGQLPITLDQAFNQMTAVGTKMLANFDEVSGLSKTIAIAFGIITDMIAEINDDLGVASDETSTWEGVATAVGNAFRGILIVVNSIVGAVRTLFVGLQGAGEITRKLLNPKEWTTIADTAKKTAESMGKVATSTMEANKALALGEKTAKTAQRVQRDTEENAKKVAAALKAQADAADKANKKTAAAKPPQMSDWDKWLQSLLDSAAALDVMPEKVAFLNSELRLMEELGEQNTAVYKVYKKTLDEISSALDPVTAAMVKFNQSIEDQSHNEAIMAKLNERLIELAFAGKTATYEFTFLNEQLAKMREAADRTGGTKVVNELIAIDKELGNLQAKFDAVNEAVAAGLISDATAEKWKRQVLGVSEATDRAVSNVKSLSEAIGEAGAKFVTDFSDKLIESFGDVSTSFGDMVNDLIKQAAKLILNSYWQQLFKSVEDAGGWSKVFGSIAGAIGGAAHGAAFDARGMQFFAQGGIVSKPTMFAHGGGLGVMGERGAEAIVPLRRDASGDLGVKASPVTVNVNNNAGVDVSTETRDNVDGSRVIDITIERKVQSMFNSGKMDRTMRSSYGLARQPG